MSFFSDLKDYFMLRIIIIILIFENLTIGLKGLLLS